jgi:RNA polymerase sigma-70 factor (ECF subfamily)
MAQVDVARREARTRGATEDDDDFHVLLEQHRAEIRLHCYRMLGSIQDAEDLTQETFLKAWRRRDAFERRSSLRTWLFRIATNTCLDALDGRKRRLLPNDQLPPSDPDRSGVASPELEWLEPYPDRMLDELSDPATRYARRETVELAFLVAIHALPPRQRAALLLRDVLEWSVAETAGMLGCSRASINSALQRARATMRRRALDRVEGSAPATSVERELLARYVRAFEAADVATLTDIIREDATMTMPPDAAWFAGREAIVRFLDRHVFAERGPLHLVPTAANRQPAFAVYERRDRWLHGLSLQVLTPGNGRIVAITGFVDPALLTVFGMPLTMPVAE